MSVTLSLERYDELCAAVRALAEARLQLQRLEDEAREVQRVSAALQLRRNALPRAVFETADGLVSVERDVPAPADFRPPLVLLRPIRFLPSVHADSRALDTGARTRSYRFDGWAVAGCPRYVEEVSS
jgi:hypothetical protein